MNELIFYEDKVVKKFGSRERFETELRMRDLFTSAFHIPRILEIDDANNTIHFKRIHSLTTHKLISKIGLEEMLVLFDKIPKLKGKRTKHKQKHYVLSKIREQDIVDFINGIVLDGNDLIHGDFRPHNILQTGRDIYLIDFELSDYGDREKDLAYWYIGTIYFDQKKGDAFLDYMKKQPNYRKFLFYCLYYSLVAKENPFSNKENLEHLRLEVYEEIKKQK